jgi:predicted phosphodiesterase
MPRIGVFSDTHANLPALRAVIRALRLCDIERFWFLGDALGYGPYAQQTLQELRDLAPEVWLMGNHDAYIGSPDASNPRDNTCLSGPIYSHGTHSAPVHVGGPRPPAWEVAQRHRGLLSEADLVWLGQLPPTAHLPSFPNLVLAHAVYWPAGTLSECVETSARTMFDFEQYFLHPHAPWHTADRQSPFLHIAGHTHREGIWERPLDRAATWVLPPEDGLVYDHPYPLKAGMFYALNPGSVGFTRGGGTCPTYFILDTDRWEVTFCALRDWRYDSELVRQDMQRQNYPEDVWSERQLRRCQTAMPTTDEGAR